MSCACSCARASTWLLICGVVICCASSLILRKRSAAPLLTPDSCSATSHIVDEVRSALLVELRAGLLDVRGIGEEIDGRERHRFRRHHHALDANRAGIDLCHARVPERTCDSIIALMTVDAQQAAMLVRATARLSAAIVAGNLLAATRRAEAVGSSALRAMDVATFVAFLASHTCISPACGSWLSQPAAPASSSA